MWNIDTEDKKIYVVEWMFDFLTLRQYKKNVIWLKSINDWLEVVRNFYKKWYEIVLIPDNDKVWLTLLEKLKDIRFKYFDLWIYQVKDINDFIIEWWYWKEVFEIIDWEKKLYSNDEIFNKNKPFTWGTHKSDNKLSPIEKNHFIIFWGKQWQWKTTFTFDMAQKNANLWHKILYLSLEMDTDKIKTNIARAYAWISKDEWRNKNITETKIKAYLKKKEDIEKIENLKLYWFTTGKNATLENIEKIILEESPDLCFIDNFDLIQVTWNLQSLEKSEKVSKFFLNFTNNNLIPCLILHHIKKWWNWIDWLRGSWKISDDADLIIFGSRHQNETDDWFSKMFILKEEKSRDWGTYETHTTYFHQWSFYDDITWFDDKDLKFNIK
jgi:hypothetical protein